MKLSPSDELASVVLRVGRAAWHALFGYIGGVLILLSLVDGLDVLRARSEGRGWFGPAIVGALFLSFGLLLQVRAWRLSR